MGKDGVGKCVSPHKARSGQKRLVIIHQSKKTLGDFEGASCKKAKN